MIFDENGKERNSSELEIKVKIACLEVDWVKQRMLSKMMLSR